MKLLRPLMTPLGHFKHPLQIAENGIFDWFYYVNRAKTLNARQIFSKAPKNHFLAKKGYSYVY